MLNRQISSSSSSSKNKDQQKTKQGPRSPLQNLNCVSGRSNCSGGGSDTFYSSSMSIEAPSGCLRFFLSNYSASKTKTPPPRRHKLLSKSTPKSAPNAKPSKSSKLPSSSSSRSRNSLKENLPKPTPLHVKPKKNPPFPRQWQPGKKPNSKSAQKPNASIGNSSDSGLALNLASGSEEFSQNVDDLNQQKQQKQCAGTLLESSAENGKLIHLPDSSTDLVGNSPPIRKLAIGSVLGGEFDDNLAEDDSTVIVAAPTTTTNTTPPVQASVSPEIQCGSSLLVSAATPSCYGAGHIVSGVTDRRKCRARGILSVGKLASPCDKTNIFDTIDDEEIISKSRMSLVPLPAEASMRWLLSPCDKDQKSDPENGLKCFQEAVKSAATFQSISTSSSGREISSDLCKLFENNSTNSSTSRRRTRITLLSPSGKPEFREQRDHRYGPTGENSPFSIGTLSSGNVIQTPQSDLSSGNRHVGLSGIRSHDHQKHDFGSEIDSVAEALLRASLSPKTRISIWNPPPGLSFQFPDLSSPSESMDLTKLPNTWDNSVSCVSNATLEDVSCSQMRISWRDGLASRIFEMDEFDCCRCLSDDEDDDVSECRNDDYKSSPSHELNVDIGDLKTFSNSFGSPEVAGDEPEIDREGKEKFSLKRSNPCAESICTDGGGLVASGDSDWQLCYKNQLFEF
ncbi:hypothetical protein U1Q18_024870 [Sarracenia purpurea var. burkii]